MKIALYGSSGQIGTVLKKAWSSHEVINIEQHDVPVSAKIVVWAATYPPPHNDFQRRFDELIKFGRMLTTIENSAETLIFSSTFGIESQNDKVIAVNAYAAAKIAAEAFIQAWTRGCSNRCGVVLRLGGFGRDTPKNAPQSMTEQDIITYYTDALVKPPGFHIVSCVPSYERTIL